MAEATKPAAKAAAPTKTAAQLRAVYESLAAQIKNGMAAYRKHQADLLKQYQEKLKEGAIDLEDLQKQKREAFIAWERQQNLEDSLARAQAAKTPAAPGKAIAEFVPPDGVANAPAPPVVVTPEQAKIAATPAPAAPAPVAPPP